MATLAGLIYWENKHQSIGLLAYLIFLITTFRYHSFFVVPVLFALSVLVVTFSCRIGYVLFKVIIDPTLEHPFSNVLQEKVEISEEDIQRWAMDLRTAVNNGIEQLQDILAVKDYFNSFKAILFCWVLRYFATCITFSTFCIMSILCVFIVPKVYQSKQKEVDELLCVVKRKMLLK